MGDQSHFGEVTVRFSARCAQLLQLGVFGFCGDEDGNVGVGVFPEREEVLIGGARLGCIAGESVGAGQSTSSPYSLSQLSLNPGP